MDPVQTALSLIAIFALAGLAWWLELGRVPRLQNEHDARDAANEAVDGFDASRVGIDKHGRGALLEAQNGDILLLKPHGNFFAGRLLGPSSSHSLEGPHMVVTSGERRFGSMKLELDDPPYWAKALGWLRRRDDA